MAEVTVLTVTIRALNEACADLLVLTEKTMIPHLRLLGLHDAADNLIESTTEYVNHPENADTVALARERHFRWMETGD